MGGPHDKNERTAKGRFAPGVSGNPGGRPKGIAAKIREKTNDGDEMIDLFLRVMRGEEMSDAMGGQGPVQIGPSHKDKLDAAKWLDIRLNGKPVDQIQISETEERAQKYLRMTREELAAAIVAAVRKPDNEEES